MIRLLVIADDFTGALDTGVQFAKHKMDTQVVTDLAFDFSSAAKPVLVIDAETRHLSPEKAADVIAKLTKRAVDAGVQTIYKKTDSALRGNIGSELASLLKASGADKLFFAPAYPKVGRITCGGIHYVDGVPVSQSAFGRDPFDPVRFSSVSELIASQTDVPVKVLPADGVPPDSKEPAIFVFDAQTDADLLTISETAQKQEVCIFAGCAGFAELLPRIMAVPAKPRECVIPVDGLTVVSGSLHPVTLRQIEKLCASGVPYFPFTAEQREDPDYASTPEGTEFLREVLAARERSGCVVLASDGRSDAAGKLRRTVSANIGRLVKGLLERGLRGVLMIIGGDTLFSVMTESRCTGITLVAELSPGVVLSEAELQGRRLYLISKSGGFGSEDTLCEIAGMVGTTLTIHK